MNQLIEWFLGLQGFYQFLTVFWVGIVIASIRLIEVSK